MNRQFPAARDKLRLEIIGKDVDDIVPKDIDAFRQKRIGSIQYMPSCGIPGFDRFAFGGGFRRECRVK